MRIKRCFNILQKSYLQGASFPQLIEAPISAKLMEVVNKYPNNLAVIGYEQNIQLTYSEVFEKAKNVAANLLELGAKKGERVGIYATSGVEWYIVQMACSLADVVFVTINPAYKTMELEHSLNLAEISILITTNRERPINMLTNVENLVDEMQVKHQLNLGLPNLPYLKSVFVINEDEFIGHRRDYYNDFKSNLIDRNPAFKYKNSVENNMKFQNFKLPATIHFTSGTGKRAKGVMLSHHNILNNAYFFGNEIKYNSDDIICLPVPIHHCFGMVMGNLASMLQGAAVLLPSPSFDAEKTLEAAYKCDATVLYGRPTHFLDYLEVQSKKEFNFQNLSKGVIGGAQCPTDLVNRVVRELFISDIYTAFGMTETSAVSFMVKKTDPTLRGTSTVGRIMKHIEAKVVDENGIPVDTNQTGELMIKGYSTMLGYYNDKQNTVKRFNDGWLVTGDLVQVDPNGYVRIISRKKGNVIKGGERISAKEIEEVLHEMDEIELAQVIGVPDDRLGMEICVFIKLKDNTVEFTNELVCRFLKEKLSQHKIPKYMKIVSDFPLNSDGIPIKLQMVKDWVTEIEEKNNSNEYLLC